MLSITVAFLKGVGAETGIMCFWALDGEVKGGGGVL